MSTTTLPAPNVVKPANAPAASFSTEWLLGPTAPAGVPAASP